MNEGLCERCGNEPCDCSDPGRVEPMSDEEVPDDQHPGVNAFLPDSDFHCGQPEWGNVDNAFDPFVPTEAEKDAAKRPRAKKEPRRQKLPVPNLEEYFDECSTPDAKRITICRAYASYLASLAPKKAKKQKRSQ